MIKALDKKRVKHYITRVSGDNSEVFRLTGAKYEKDAKAEFLSGNYRQSFLDHRNAARCYKGALDKLGSNSNDVNCKENLETMYLVARMGARKAALYNATVKTPFLFRGLLRRIKGRHILASFIIALFNSLPSLTGNVVGISNSFTPFIGFVFFSLGLFLLYFYIKKMILIAEK